MAFKRAVICLAVLASVNCGCMTYSNIAYFGKNSGSGDEKKAYGGVKKDVFLIEENSFNHGSYKELEGLIAIFAILDLPFTIIGDTFTLPLTVAYDYDLFGKRHTTGANAAQKSIDANANNDIR
jgi:uncharacterized protein YceK